MLLRQAPLYLRSQFASSKKGIYTLLLSSAAAFSPIADGIADEARTKHISWDSANPLTSSKQSSIKNSNLLVASNDLGDVSQDLNTQATGNAQTPPEMSNAQPAANGAQNPAPTGTGKSMSAQGPVITFNNVSITELLRFVSRLTGKNFIYDPSLLQFPVTIISETPASLEDVMAALIQNLRIHGFYMVEEGNTFIIHQNPDFRAPGGLLHIDENGNEAPELATAVFQIGNVSPGRVATIVKTMLTKDAVVEIVEETMRVVITDMLANIKKISEIIKKIDAPNSGLEIGQYVALNNSPSTLISICQRILQPLASDKAFVLVPYQASNSVFIVSTPFLVEKALSVLQSLDLNQTTFGALNVDQMKFDAQTARKMQETQSVEIQKQRETPIPLTQEEVDSFSDRERNALMMAKGFTAEQIVKMTPEQIARILREKGISTLEREKVLGQKRSLFESELPLGQAEATQFLIHKLAYRKVDEIVKALTAIATSLNGGPVQQQGGKNSLAPSDLVVTLNSVQGIQESNSIVFTGTKLTLQRVKELIGQIDVPVRQVFIEAVVFSTTLNNSLNFGLEWGGKIQAKNWSYQGGLITGPSSTTNSSVIATPLAAIGFPGAHHLLPDPNQAPSFTNNTGVLPALPLNEGFTASAIGRKIKFGGKGFQATAAFVNLLSTTDDTEVILNPKIVTEHNVPAEIFVGAQVPIKGQSIVNSTASNTTNTVATNYETQNVGVDLKVTPLISSSDTVTLIIEITDSSTDNIQVQAQGGNSAPPATVSEIKTTTRVHMPSDYFLMMSGMLQSQTRRQIGGIPLLSSIPILGYFFSNKQIHDSKQNVIMYIRPKILDTPIDIERHTQNQQTVFEEANGRASGWTKQWNDLKELLNF